MVAIARFCDCKVWLTRSELGVTYIFFGLETDAMLGRCVFEVIAAALRTELAGFKDRNPRLRGVALRRAGDSFQHGMVAGVAARLTMVRADRDASVSAQRPTGNALMLVKHQLVEEAFAATQTCLVSTRQSARTIVRSALPGRGAGGRQGQPQPSVDRQSADVGVMTCQQDSQRTRVYAWEDKVVALTDHRIVPFSAAQGMVDAIWSELGLHYPPEVERLPRQSRRLIADGSRLRLRLPDTSVALHETGSVAICVIDLADRLTLWVPCEMKDLQRWDLGPGVQVKAVECRPDKWVITADASGSASCPQCGRASIRRHGTCARSLQDLPVQGKPVEVLLRTSRWRCCNASCLRQTFAGRITAVAISHARQTTRVAELARLVGHVAGGRCLIIIGTEGSVAAGVAIGDAGSLIAFARGLAGERSERRLGDDSLDATLTALALATRAGTAPERIVAIAPRIACT